jgi:hypothetical protein
MALEGKTPADVAGIEIRGQNKWITIIQTANAFSKPKPKLCRHADYS